MILTYFKIIEISKLPNNYRIYLDYFDIIYKKKHISWQNFLDPEILNSYFKFDHLILYSKDIISC